MDILGYIGIIGLLVFYISITYFKMNPKGFIYQFGNFLTVSLLVIYAYSIHAVPIMILDGIFSIIALIGILKIVIERRNQERNYAREK